MIFDPDEQVEFFSPGDDRFQSFDVLGDSFLGSIALDLLIDTGISDEHGAAKFLGDRHPGLTAVQTWIVNGVDANFDFVLIEQRSEGVVSHLLYLFAMISMTFRPDIDVFRIRLTHFGDHLGNRQPTIHAGGDDVFELEYGLGSG